ncbi:family 43 glycosylhydrolase [Sphingobacterium arenae]|uniref:Family 43 glycosylhydrolase n=2 Tax=Sphingobacterium arenae TaxID=1280598 RepID=A0ABR7Y235_9SPHI|nr:family 43 glycosylhydrolase [Sphingobacterium arenae]
MLFLFLTITVHSQSMRADTYCNPLNLDYTYMIYNAHRDISYRSGADPAVVEFRGEYYMFVTRSMGYWHSTDLQNWNFITPEKWYFEGSNAPAAHNYKDSVLYVTGNPSGHMSVLYTDDPKKGDWKATPSIINNLQDPDLFIDDDGQAYMFWGSSNKFPIRGRKLDKNKRFIADSVIAELFNLEPEKHGWERFGENHTDTVLGGYIEGPWLTKHNNKYYMQYAAPGTQFNVYGDGVYIADHPLGPYTYQAHNPVSYKPGGYMNGAGHGSTVIGPGGHYWHFATMDYSVNMTWERRLCMFPTFFDDDGIMYTDTYFGDYPRYAPSVPNKRGAFRGWMLLSYNKPVRVSSAQDGYDASALTDEIAKTSWLAENNDASQWVIVDLEKPADIYAIQINYADYRSDMYGRIEGLRHRYTLEGSADGKNWFKMVDKSNSFRDTPNDYIELESAVSTRYIRYKNIEVPTPHLAMSEIRIFGIGNGKKPAPVKNFQLERQMDRRDISLHWTKQNNAQGYNVRWGIAPDKLYSSWMVYGDNELLLKSLNTDQTYYFAIEAFNENGVSELSAITKIE